MNVLKDIRPGMVGKPSQWDGVLEIVKADATPFIDKWLYLITFGVICLITLGLMIYKFKYRKSILIDKHFNLVFIFLGLMIMTDVLIYILESIRRHKYTHLLFGDLCAMLGLISGPIFISRKKALIKTIAPWMILGGILTILSSTVPFHSDSRIFGTVSYIKHVLMVIMGIVAINHLGTYSRREWIYTMIFPFVFIAWILLTSGIAYFVTNDPKFGASSTALLEPAYHELWIPEGGTYSLAGDYSFMNDILPYPYATIIFYAISLVTVSLFVWILPKFSGWLHREPKGNVVK